MMHYCKDTSSRKSGNQNPEQTPLRAANQVRNTRDDLGETPGFESARWFKRRGIGTREAAELSSLELLHRARSLSGAIEEEFVGGPFLPDGPPESNDNQNRFKAYMGYYMQVATLLKAAVQIAVALDEPPEKPLGGGVRKTRRSSDSRRAGNGSSEDNRKPVPTSEEKQQIRPQRGRRRKA